MDNCKKRTIIQDDDTSDTKKPKVSMLRELHKPYHSSYCASSSPSITSFTLPDDITCDMINIVFQKLLNLYTTNTHLYVFDIIKVNHEKFTIKANATILYGDLPISCGFKVYLFKIPNKDNILIDIMQHEPSISSFYDLNTIHSGHPALNYVYKYTRFYFSIN